MAEIRFTPRRASYRRSRLKALHQAKAWSSILATNSRLVLDPTTLVGVKADPRASRTRAANDHYNHRNYIDPPDANDP